MLLNLISELYKSFLSGLASTDPKFPASERDCLIQQSVITLNIFHNSLLNPKLSSHAYLHSNLEFNATPLAPLVTRVLVH